MSDMEVNFKSLIQGQTGPETKEFPALIVKSIDQGKRQVRVLASTADLDRDGERILPEAFRERLSAFQSNPVILAAHCHRLSDGEPSVVGRAEKIWIDKKGLWCIIQFAETDLAEKYWQLYSQGYMKAVSIGFIAISWRDEIEDGGHVRIYDAVELLEISLVAVPSNREALTRSKQRKADFVQQKLQEREEEKILAELRAEDPDFDAKADDFAEMIMGIESDGEILKDCSDVNFAKAARGESEIENEFASLVRGG